MKMVIVDGLNRERRKERMTILYVRGLGGGTDIQQQRQERKHAPSHAE